MPKAARTLIWEVFFVSRQRGIDLQTHFPWIDQDIGTYCFMVTENNSGTCVATLVLRIHNIISESRLAMIGMVCVDRKWRGQGLSTRLLTNAINFAAEQQINNLLLWTTQPYIYSGHGFVSDNVINDSFAKVTLNKIQKYNQLVFTKGKYTKSRGLPPFGQQVIRIKSDSAELIGVETGESVTLAEWKGSLQAVLDLIEDSMPATWNLNAPADSTIFDELKNRGHKYLFQPCATRMVRQLDSRMYIPYISILERI